MFKKRGSGKSYLVEVMFINSAIAEKLSALRTELYFKNRAARANIPKALRILKFAGLKNPPLHGDEPYKITPVS